MSKKKQTDPAPVRGEFSGPPNVDPKPGDGGASAQAQPADPPKAPATVEDDGA